MLTGRVRWALATGAMLLATVGLAPDQVRSPSKAAETPHARLPAAPRSVADFVPASIAPES